MKELDRRVLRLERSVEKRRRVPADPERVRTALDGYARSMNVSVDQLMPLAEQFLKQEQRRMLRDEWTHKRMRVALFLTGLTNAKAARARVYRPGKRKRI